MSKADLHIKMDPALADAIRQYARGRGVTFTAALSVLAARGLADEGITIKGDGNDENES